MRHPILLALLCALFASAQACGADTEKGVTELHGQWNCDGSATLDHLPSSDKLPPLDRLLSARLLDSMSMFINAAEGTIRLNLGNLKERQSFTVLRSDGRRFALQAKEVLTLELRDDGSLLFADPVDETKKMVFRRR